MPKFNEGHQSTNQKISTDSKWYIDLETHTKIQYNQSKD